MHFTCFRGFGWSIFQMLTCLSRHGERPYRAGHNRLKNENATPPSSTFWNGRVPKHLVKPQGGSLLTEFQQESDWIKAASKGSPDSSGLEAWAAKFQTPQFDQSYHSITRLIMIRDGNSNNYCLRRSWSQADRSARISLGTRIKYSKLRLKMRESLRYWMAYINMPTELQSQ